MRKTRWRASSDAEPGWPFLTRGECRFGASFATRPRFAPALAALASVGRVAPG